MPRWATQIPLQDQALVTLSSWVNTSPATAFGSRELPGLRSCHSPEWLTLGCGEGIKAPHLSARHLWRAIPALDLLKGWPRPPWDNTGAQPLPLPCPDSFPSPRAITLSAHPNGSPLPKSPSPSWLLRNWPSKAFKFNHSVKLSYNLSVTLILLIVQKSKWATGQWNFFSDEIIRDHSGKQRLQYAFRGKLWTT